MLRYLFYKVHRGDIAQIKFLLESYENIFSVSTVDKDLPKIQLTIPKDYLSDAEEILKDLSETFFMERIEEDPLTSQGRY